MWNDGDGFRGLFADGGSGELRDSEESPFFYTLVFQQLFSHLGKADACVWDDKTLFCSSSELRGPQPRRAEARGGIRLVAFSAGRCPNTR